ncbi:hypothetical protein MHI24_09955 [Paenibacillus sp. FSL K6-1096]|uniref:hypothetical protein n=1 Tax=Paenibacillus sp. FSL K6-1096 TaxID=2921460 RepID=UPI0030EE7804
MSYSFVVEPLAIQDFESEDELIERCKEWNLLSGSATRPKTYQYKRQGLSLPCEIVGYVDNQTVVIQFENKQHHCIHPAYLKEMQTASFGQRGFSATEAKTEEALEEGGEITEAEEASGEGALLDADAVGGDGLGESGVAEVAESEGSEAGAGSAASAKQTAPESKPAKPAAKKKAAVQLPEDKLKITAVVKEFTTVPNHFSDNDDEVIIYEGITIEGHDLPIEEVWSSHSATLKKLELKEGDRLSCEAKIVAKKLTQHPVKYKINNPSKLQVIPPEG